MEHQERNVTCTDACVCKGTQMFCDVLQMYEAERFGRSDWYGIEQTRSCKQHVETHTIVSLNGIGAVGDSVEPACAL